jgi:hypothetical protein
MFHYETRYDSHPSIMGLAQCGTTQPIVPMGIQLLKYGLKFWLKYWLQMSSSLIMTHIDFPSHVLHKDFQILLIEAMINW